MKTVSNIVGVLLGLAFIVFGANFFLEFMPKPPNPLASLEPEEF